MMVFFHHQPFTYIQVNVIQTLCCDLGAAEMLVAKDKDGNTPAHLACKYLSKSGVGALDFLEVLSRNGAAASLVVANNDGL